MTAESDKELLQVAVVDQAGKAVLKVNRETRGVIDDNNNKNAGFVTNKCLCIL